MARVVKPGGMIATYMWDIPGGGLPVNPIYIGFEGAGAGDLRPAVAPHSNRDTMGTDLGNRPVCNVETEVVRIQVAYYDFDDFWQSCNVPVGPSGNAVADLSPEDREELKEYLRDYLPAAADGRIVYEAFTNAVKGRAPG